MSGLTTRQRPPHQRLSPGRQTGNWEGSPRSAGAAVRKL